MAASKQFMPDIAPNTVRQFVNEEVLSLLSKNPDLVRHLEAKGAAEKGKKRSTDRHYEDGMQAMANMLARTQKEDGARDMKYAYGKNRRSGPLYAKYKGSLQTAPTYTRHALTRGVLRDWDMANAYFTVCKDVCRMINIPCPMIDEYCDNREPTLTGVCERIGLGRGSAKSLLLSILNGLTNFSRQELKGDAWLHRFADECERVQACFVRAYPDVAAKK
ncbi:hypothetical protein JKP88DRAFT_277056 [Tribonema minus]|uniref:Uncharacterized protein n=1 Tax=Tribonema minus TaxID=303371 RepID=A0A835YZI6_9STRA|nr:hypothetical protein JKP88DRAFT_277056 [Tribonema minus]